MTSNHFVIRVQTKEDFFQQKMGDTIFNIDLTNLKIPLQTLFCISKRLRISKYLENKSISYFDDLKLYFI